MVVNSAWRSDLKQTGLTTAWKKNSNYMRHLRSLSGLKSVIDLLTSISGVHLQRNKIMISVFKAFVP